MFGGLGALFGGLGAHKDLLKKVGLAGLSSGIQGETGMPPGMAQAQLGQMQNPQMDIQALLKELLAGGQMGMMPGAAAGMGGIVPQYSGFKPDAMMQSKGMPAKGMPMGKPMMKHPRGKF